MASVRDFELEENRDVGPQPIRAVVSDDAVDESGEVDEYIGFTMFSTIGEEWMVPRDELLTRMDELGLPVWLPDRGPESESPKEYMAPPKVTPKRAFNRVRKYMIGAHNETQEIDGQEYEFEVSKVDNDEFHLHVSTFLSPEELVQIDDLAEQPDYGEERQRTLGVFVYADEDVPGMQDHPKIEEDDPMWDQWLMWKDEAHRLFGDHLTSHIGKDIQKMMYKYTHYWTRSIKMREGGAVYFVPSKHEESLDALKRLVDSLNEFKDRGHPARINRITTVNAAEERQMVENRAREQAREKAEDALEAAIEGYEAGLEADEENLVDSLIDELRDDLADHLDFAGEYEALLDCEIAIESVVDEWKNERNLKGEKEHIVETALEEAEKGETHTVEAD